MGVNFKQLVEQVRNQALSEIERKRKAVYAALVTDEVKQGKCVPMPKDFWKNAGLADKVGSQSHSPQSEKAAEQSSLEAVALLILGRAMRAMTVAEIVSIAQAEGLWQCETETAKALLNARLEAHIQAHGEKSQFVKIATTYALRQWQIASAKKRSKMGYKQVALYLLEREKKPLTAKQIISLAISEGLIEITSKQPDATLAGQLHTEMRRLGAQSAIVQVGPRTYALRKWCDEG
ncbi:MAG: winged helix-turn-helix domain-containing protein [Acidobacteriota bacterium]|nr:winged helix-turn-helix domain-containing protein [Blastocatellia bacterium]MDW8411763.1 winged helix-turn-helix domain-containing protein [Acidobacteriota bacterium]